MKKIAKSLTGLFFLALGITSCGDEEYFDKAKYQQLVSDAFGIEDVDKGHTWQTIGTADVNITATMSYGDSCKIHIYSDNPITEKTVQLLGAATIANGSTYTGNISYPLISPTVYIALTDSKGYMMVYPKTIADSALTAVIGNVPATAAAAKAMRRALASTYTFTAAPADADFKSEAPSNISPSATIEAASGTFVANSSTRKINAWGAITLYVTGTVNPTQQLYVAGNSTIYVCDGATLNLDNISSGANAVNYGTKVYVAPTGKIVSANTALTLNAGTVYNRGSITALSISGNSQGVLYNQGTVAATHAVDVKNWNTELINEGSLQAEALNIEGSGRFRNDGTAAITGLTLVNSSACTWVNNGSYTTDNFTYQAGSQDIINNCQMTVNNTMLISTGAGDAKFKMDGGSSVVTKYLKMEKGTVQMGSNSILQVTETATMDCRNAGYGFYGVGNEYAVLQAKAVVAGAANQGYLVTYGGNLYVASDSHFAQGYSGSYPYYVMQDNAAFATSYTGAPVSISGSSCSAGYTPGTPTTPEVEEEPLNMRFCFEDNFPVPGDYDFNDVVITVTPEDIGWAMKLTIRLDAVGASKQLAAALRIKGLKASDLSAYWIDGADFGDLYYKPAVNTEMIPNGNIIVPDNKNLTPDKDVVFYLFNDAHYCLNRGTYSSNGSIERLYYNTVKDKENSKGRVLDTKEIKLYIQPSNQADVSKINSKTMDLFVIESYNGSNWEVHTYPFKTDEVLNRYIANKDDYSDPYPWAILVPGSFKYPAEWQPVGSYKSNISGGAYQTSAHSFGEWAHDHTTATDWYLNKYAESELVY